MLKPEEQQKAAAMPEEPIPPVRGLVLTHNRRGVPYALTDIKKWVRLNARVFKVEKIDLLAEFGCFGFVPDLLAFVREEHVVLSLRTAENEAPAALKAWADAGLQDVFLCPVQPDTAALGVWLDAATAAGLDARVQLSVPAGPLPDPETLAACLARAVSVNVALYDPFTTAPGSAGEDDRQTVSWMNRLVRALDDCGVEVNLIGLPYCHVDEANYPHLQNRQQFFLDHQQYNKNSYELAEKISVCGPRRMSKVMENLLARGASMHHAIDRILLPWIFDHPAAHVRLWMLHKVTRHFRFLQRQQPFPESVSACEAALEALRLEQRRTLGPECAKCRFQRICDHETEPFRRLLPTLRARAAAGEPAVSPRHFATGRPRHFDTIDGARRKLPEHLAALAEIARNITMRETPTREIPVSAYAIENHFTPEDDASKRWYSFSRGELLSTEFGKVEPPFTLALTFGGGIAEQIGFSFGPHAKVVCPMIDYSHRLTLHVDAAGYYVLLRDGVQVRPTEFEGVPRCPARLSGRLEPRICMRNVDGFILTQTLMLWKGDAPAAHGAGQLRYSVIIVSTRYARRLQAVLLALAHQRGVDPACFEVVLAHVPGIDATDDLIEGMRQAHPHLRIVSSCFSPDHARSKGFMINQSLRVASGEWIVLIDSDIIVPPNLFKKLAEAESGAHFIAPDGRRMLTPETTSRVLLGEVRPWEEFDAVAASTDDYRYREGAGVPCGFFQAVRRDVLEALPYQELDHFEGSDWIFGRDVINRFGKETRLEGVDVLHLDHGGRQWYGTEKHR
jgi:hypothetical protein